MIARTPAERLDRALDELVNPSRSTADPDLRPLLDTALLLERSLVPVPAAAPFENELAAHLAQRGMISRNLHALGAVTRRELRHPSRLLVTGAVSSAAVGCVTALAIWRGTRRSAQQRLVSR